jgi:hypothetical protein
LHLGRTNFPEGSVDDPVDKRAAAASEAYGGYQTRAQLLALGISSRQIASRVKRGWLFPEYWRVYAVGHRPVLPVDRAHGALLAAGPKSALSHRSAASLSALVKDWQFPFEVTTVEDRRVTGITIHRSTTLKPRDVTVQLGLRTTTVARTIFDLAPSLSDRELERMIDTALHTPYMSVEQLHELISRLPHTAAARRLRNLLEPGYRPTRSELERARRRWCRAYDIPVGLINHPHHGVVLDAYYPEHKLIVELDSLEYHTDRTTFQRDREKDRQHLAGGDATIRLTWEALHLDPAGEAELFHDILRQRRHAA